MNIQDFMDEVIESGPYTPAQLLAERKASFLGFCEVEKGQGGIDPAVDLSMPEGQRNARVLFARCIEEVLEAIEADDEDHFYEELIDALNFGASILYLSGLSPEAEPRVTNALTAGLTEKSIYKSDVGLTKSVTLVGFVAFVFGDFLPKLRNRSWQNSVQHPYFMGEDELTGCVINLWLIIAQRFKSYDHFAEFFMAKDRVLKFRLETKY